MAVNENTTLGQLDGMIALRDLRVSVRIHARTFYVSVRPSFDGLLENLETGVGPTLATAFDKALAKYDARRGQEARKR